MTALPDVETIQRLMLAAVLHPIEKCIERKRPPSAPVANVMTTDV